MRHMIFLDTLHLSVKLPVNLYDRWLVKLPSLDHALLRQGVVLDREGFVARLGSNGYQFSLWRGDARAFLAKRDEQGLWLQLGPKFLQENKDRLRVAVWDFLVELGVLREWFRPDHLNGGLRQCQIKLNRADVAVDCIGHDLSEMSGDDWAAGWVGWARNFDNFRSLGKLRGGLETIAIGSRNSAVYLRVYDKRLQATKTGDIDFWRQVWGLGESDDLPPVTRVEWEVKVKDGGFDALRDFYTWSDEQMKELLNYLYTWGSLRVPSASDETVTRWEVHPFWAALVEAVQDFGDGVSSRAERVHKPLRRMTEQYWKFVAGTIAGAAARFGRGKASLVDMFEYLTEAGLDHGAIMGKADKLFEKLVLLGLVPAPPPAQVRG